MTSTLLLLSKIVNHSVNEAVGVKCDFVMEGEGKTGQEEGSVKIGEKKSERETAKKKLKTDLREKERVRERERERERESV